MTDNGKYFCFEHGVEYTYDDFICPQCENEIFEQHDQHYKEKQMTDKFVPQDTTYIQEESVTNFMAALGYEPVYGGWYGSLLRFSQPRFAKHGEAIVSVNRAIKLHNQRGEEAFAELVAFTGQTTHELRDYIAKYSNYQTIMFAAAGATKIVEQVKASFSRKKGFVVHDHNIKFMTRRDANLHKHLM
ncbi:hypothetical protein MT_57011 [Pseudomonas phage phiPto-bp6g]|nr:hypothetical protein MT_57011 [Pseudomonas phage phiPto-bp6g]